MQLSEQWLRTYADPQWSSEELSERLTLAGLEVESNEPVAPPFSGVVVGHVIRIERHPNADKLTVCEVDIATDRLSIVCGAPNVAPGIKVPCAVPGATLPGGLQINTTTMRGVPSHGMLCSARELGLSDDHQGLLILAPDAPIGADVRDLLALDDRKLTVSLTPDRADCLSVVGVAREVSALMGRPLTLPRIESVQSVITDRLPVSIEAPDLCGRFAGRVIRDLDAKAPTPAWMKQRIERSGQRPISALVDISNYVMLELGRPTHIFDLDTIDGGLTVRWGRSRERVKLLNGQTIEVDPTVGVIADDRAVEALAGIMGGEATAVSLETRNIYVEAAFWWPDAIRGRARRYNFSTDASHRFERGVDFSTNADHIEYVTRLIVDICGGNPGPVDDQITSLPVRKPITMRIERCRRVLGIEVGEEAIATAFRRIGFDFQQQASIFVVTPPPFRFDLEIEEDLIGEVARLIGYDAIPSHPPRTPAVMRAPTEEQRSAHDVRRALALGGYTETVSYAFVDADSERDFAANENPIAVVNPIAEQMSVMRSTLLISLINALSYNLKRRAARVRLFEIGRVYRRDQQATDGPLQVAGVAQPLHVAAVAYGPNDDEQWGVGSRDVDYFDIKGDLERLLRSARFMPALHPTLHPGRSAAIEVDGIPVGVIGELHPRLQQKYELPKAPVVFELLLEPLLHADIPQFAEVPKSQPVQRDISITVGEEVAVQAVIDSIHERARHDARLANLRSFNLFDLYRPRSNSSKVAEASANALLNNEKSLAFRLVLQDTDGPVTETDADAALNAIVKVLHEQFGARLRQ